MFERLLESGGERTACRIMVELLAMAHERGCEAELAGLLEADVAARRSPMAGLRARYSPDPGQLPTVVVKLGGLASRNALIGWGEAA
jgi:hypothetical protein